MTDLFENPMGLCGFEFVEFAFKIGHRQIPQKRIRFQQGAQKLLIKSAKRQVEITNSKKFVQDKIKNIPALVTKERDNLNKIKVRLDEYKARKLRLENDYQDALDEISRRELAETGAEGKVGEGNRFEEENK